MRLRDDEGAEVELCGDGGLRTAWVLRGVWNSWWFLRVGWRLVPRGEDDGERTGNPKGHIIECVRTLTSPSRPTGNDRVTNNETRIAALYVGS